VDVITADGQVHPGTTVGLDGLFDFAVDLIATLVAFQNVKAAAAAVRSAGDVPVDESVATGLLGRRLSQLRTTADLAATYSEQELLDMAERLWDSLVRHHEGIERGFGDAGRVRLLRKKARDFHRLVSADPPPNPPVGGFGGAPLEVVAKMLGVANESTVRALLRPEGLSPRNRLALEDVDGRVLRPPRT
jgi:hypothetical protein